MLLIQHAMRASMHVDVSSRALIVYIYVHLHIHAVLSPHTGLRVSSVVC